MSSFNRVVLIGNLTRDPEFRNAGSSGVTQMSLALNRKWKGRDGNAMEEVSYIDVDAWGKLADISRDYLKKGRSVLIEGRLKQERWESNQTGQKMSRIKVIAESIVFLGSPDKKHDGIPQEDQAPSAESAYTDSDTPF